MANTMSKEHDLADEKASTEARPTVLRVVWEARLGA